MRASLHRNPKVFSPPARGNGVVSLRLEHHIEGPLRRPPVLKTVHVRQPFGRLYAAVEEEAEPEGEAEPEAEPEAAPRQEPFGERRPRRGRDGKDYDERVVELRRVAATVKGGRTISFRAVMVVGDRNGTVGVGNASAKEIPVACRKAALDATRNLIKVHLDPKSRSFPHLQKAKFGGALVLLRPAGDGTGLDVCWD